MLEELSAIKIKRNSMGIKQKELAHLSGISQSMIAKIESGRVTPSYVVAKRIFEALRSAERDKEKLCGDIMIKKIIKLEEKDSVKKAIKLMKSNNISQIPVFRELRPIGSISESSILDYLTGEASREEVLEMRVGDIMDVSFPVVNKFSSIQGIIPLIASTYAVLIENKGLIVGIITKTDLL